MNLVLVRIYEKKTMIKEKGGDSREVAVHLCLTLILKYLKLVLSIEGW